MEMMIRFTDIPEEVRKSAETTIDCIYFTMKNAWCNKHGKKSKRLLVDFFEQSAVTNADGITTYYLNDPMDSDVVYDIQLDDIETLNEIIFDESRHRFIPKFVDAQVGVGDCSRSFSECSMIG